jgi:hypothetical protein
MGGRAAELRLGSHLASVVLLVVGVVMHFAAPPASADLESASLSDRAGHMAPCAATLRLDCIEQ